MISRLRRWNSLLWIILATLCLSGCTYLKYSAIQAEYARIQNADPSQVNLKHLLDRNTFFVIGITQGDPKKYSDMPMVVAAYSSDLKENEQVDRMFFTGVGTHYGLNLPGGRYTLLVYADLNGDGVTDNTEVVGQQSLKLEESEKNPRVVNQVDIHLGAAVSVPWAKNFQLPKAAEALVSAFYPSGTIRSLDDPLFDERISTLGMYDPASFLAHAPTMFYALEDDFGHKIPVIFVHGIDGSPRQFQSLVEHLDRERYKPWFFYYPSGGDLNHLADFFYQLFLSGEVIHLHDVPIIIVAHSMGGLVVREALNKYQHTAKENKIKRIFTIATPFGGHPAAAMSERQGIMVLPAWRDLNPDGKFIKNLYRKPIPELVEHQLLYAYKNTSTVKLGENSDGVVPLTSQLYPVAQRQADVKFGFNSNHMDVLNDQELIEHLTAEVTRVKGPLPEDHMQVFIRGAGLDVELDKSYSQVARHNIKYAGRYLVMLVHGLLEPYNLEQRRFIDAVRGESSTISPIEKEYRNFLNEHSALVAKVLSEFE